ncbi:MAG: hypothetical protein H7833_18195 [Magnetococcus sp. DMHC-1]|nr:hypothetical protein [Magnetococcales bacterium]
MEALLSGPAGMGVLLDRAQAWVVRLDQPDTLPEATTPDLASRLLWGRERDLRRFQVQNFHEAYQHLEVLYGKAKALNFTFSFLSDRASDNSRRFAAQVLEKTLQSQDIWNYVAGVLHAEPLPKPDICDLVIPLAETLALSRTLALLQEVKEGQQEIGLVAQAWDAIPNTCFNPLADRPVCLQTAVEGGLFLDLVRVVRGLAKPGPLQLRAIKILQEFSGHREIVKSWKAPFQITSSRAGSVRLKLEKEKIERDRAAAEAMQLISALEAFERANTEAKQPIPDLHKEQNITDTETM